MAILDLFIGVPQSKYAAVATLAAIVAVAVAMLVGKDSLTMGQKFVAILLMFLFALPGLLLSLFQLTCLVTGAGKKTWLCGVYAWIGTIIAFLWALVIISIVIMSIAKGTSVNAELIAAGAAPEAFADMKAAAAAARKMADKAAKEMFADGDAATADAALPPMTAAEQVSEAELAAAAKAEEEAKKAAAAAAEGTIVPAMASEAPASEILIPESFVGAAPAKGAAAAMPAPSAPETFTSCGAPIMF